MNAMPDAQLATLAFMHSTLEKMVEFTRESSGWW